MSHNLKKVLDTAVSRGQCSRNSFAYILWILAFAKKENIEQTWGPERCLNNENTKIGTDWAKQTFIPVAPL